MKAHIGVDDESGLTHHVECTAANVDYLGMDTSVGFDKALIEYLVQRQRRFG